LRLAHPTLLALALALTLPAGVPGLASETSAYGPNAPFGQDPHPSTAPTIQVYSRETILDVLVTDDKGQPVRGLTQSDFTVTEDGAPQPIRSFAEYSKDAPPAPARALPPNTYTNTHSLPASGPVQILYFIMPPPDGGEASLCQGALIARAKQYMADYLRTMPAGTQVAIFAFLQDRGLNLVQGFTTDGARAAAAVDSLVVQRIGSGSHADPIAAADQIAAYVAGIHGRKNLIWVGAPMAIMRDGGLSWSNPLRPSAPDMTYVHRLMDTYDRFTEEQIAIYPFDPMGIPAKGLIRCPQPPPLAFRTLRAEDIATETGGAAIYNTNDFKGAVAKIVDDTSHFYTLSYVPTRPDSDGHYHPIKITVDRPGLHLTYRSGYNDERPAPPDAVLKIHMNQGTMGLGALPATQLTFDVQVTPGAANSKTSNARRALLLSGKTPVTYNLIYKLDQSQIDFATSTGGVRNASIEFDLAAYDSDGKLLTVRSQTLKLPLSPQEYQEFVQTPFQFLLPVDLPPGELTLRVGVFDGISSKAGTLEIPLAIPKK
jgi:VWFA-related protein